MANEDHVALLRQGVDVWNAWREENSDIWRRDLSGANLVEGDPSGADLHSADLSGTHLYYPNLYARATEWSCAALDAD